MAELINHNSFLILGLIVLLIGGRVIFKNGFNLKPAITFSALVVVVAMGYLALRPNPATSSQTEDITSQIGRGKPVLLELQSPN